MGARVRSRILEYNYKGTLTNWLNTTPTVIQGSDGVCVYETMSDTTGPKPYIDHPLVLTRYEVTPFIQNGTAVVSSTRHTVYDNYNQPSRAEYSFCPTPTVVDWVYYKTKALANMNPNKPDVDVPVFIFELKDLPEMLHQAGRILQKGAKASDAAGAYVSYSFGWAPLISDTRKLVNFSSSVNNKLKYLLKTSAKGGARISRKLDDTKTTLSTSSFNGSTPAFSAIPSFEGSRIIEEHRKVWAVANVATFPTPNEIDHPNLTAARAAFGLNLSAASLWEAIPWSWLIDYLGNVGDFLDANRGFIPSTITKMNLMCTQVVTDRLSGRSRWGITFNDDHEMVTIRKSRNVSSVPTPSLAFRPWFTPHMAGILASLATSKAFKRLRL